MEGVEKVLGSLGKKLKSHELHVRRSHNGGLIVRHDMRDEDGNLPTDGQKPDREYTIKNLAELASHFGTHMPDEPDEEAAPE
jgi:hypothetical protein